MPVLTGNHPKFEIEKINFYYGALQVLRDINLTIPTGYITSIIGPSGTGKSTFLRLLNRMSDLTPGARVEGSIRLEGKDIFTEINPVDLRYRVGMVFQMPNPFPKSIYDNVAYGPRMHGLRDKKELETLVEGSLREAFLWDEVKDNLHLSALSLSGGQQQRLCIARSLAVAPEVLLLDEPCSALDPIATFKIEQLLAELAGRYTLVIVTHNMQQAARISHYTGVFMLVKDQAGELVEFGPTNEVFTNPKSPTTEAFLTGRIG
ncbi:MAG: phosphate ABC transporter ATP-binding protein [Chloroflexi bacterium 54-19]|nr:MAG: phosphate ABC transporter ATP-binding protein [Chloroflexi bacterium 54-19]